MKAEELIKKYGLDTTSWTFKGFHGIPFTFWYITNSMSASCKAYYGYSLSKSIWFVSKDYVSYYWPDNEMRILRKILVDNVNKNPRYLKNMRRHWEIKMGQLQSVFKNIDKTELSQISTQELFELYDKLGKAYAEQFGLVMAPGDAFSMYSSEFLEPLFAKFLKSKGKLEKFSEYYTKLTAPVEESFLSEEKRDLLNIVSTAKKYGIDSKKTTELLISHQQKYFWIRNNYAKQEVLSVNFFKNELKSLQINAKSEILRMKSELSLAKSEKKKLANTLKLPSELSNLFSMAEDFLYIQDTRKKHVLIANYYFRKFIREISRRRNIPEKLVEYMVYPETNQRIDLKKLKKRYKNCVCIGSSTGYQVIGGKQASRLFYKLFKEKKRKVKEFSGVSASSGKAVGRVKILQKTHDIINFKQNDIIVSSMTRPEMVVALKKAKAIVTDEGGITSHAAIISRELAIPCIIGTKIATKVLKDGDLILVDADSGVVRKLK